MTGALGAGSVSVLLIEDDVDLREVLSEILVEAGFRVTLADTHAAAERHLRATAFALVVADYFVGTVESSRRAAESLLDTAGHVPVGCVTAWRDVPPALESRFAFKLNKPVDAQQFLGAVGRHAASVAPDTQRAEVIGRYFQALSQEDWTGVVDLCTDGVEYHLPGTHPLSGTVVGREAFRAYTVETFQAFPHPRFTVNEIAWLPHGAVASYRGEWKTGAQLSDTTGAVYFQFEDAHISSIGVRTDLARLSSAGRLAARLTLVPRDRP